MTRTDIRWVLLPFEIILAFIVTGIGAAFVSGWLYLWYQPFAGFFAAAAVVCVAYLGAPRWKLLTALVTLILGGALAYRLLDGSFYPENYAVPYSPTSMPFWVTLSGGVLALAAVSLHAYVKRRST